MLQLLVRAPDFEWQVEGEAHVKFCHSDPSSVPLLHFRK